MTDSTTNQGLKSAFSRRAFMRGSGAVAATAALQTQQVAAEDKSSEIVSGQKTISLNVNRKDYSLRIEPRDTLLDVLRYKLDLTGAKPVSSDGSSGASTVMIDGKPKTASTTFAIACVGKRIVTAEGLDDKKVPEAFVKYDAQQCGFCTPGFVVALHAFLNKYPHATEDQIRQGLNGNICRCGTYANVIQAAVSVVKGGK